MNANVDELRETLARARQEVAKVIIGQNEVVDKALITIFTGHHALIEGVPGVAKTLLVPDQQPVTTIAVPRRRPESRPGAAHRRRVESGFLMLPATGEVAHGQLRRAAERVEGMAPAKLVSQFLSKRHLKSSSHFSPHLIAYS